VERPGLLCAAALIKKKPRPGNLWVSGGSRLKLTEEAVEFAASGVERALLLFRAVVDQRATVLVDGVAKKSVSSHLSEIRVIVEVADDFSTQRPEVVHVPANGLRGKSR
jgi:hypothetical protein